jgi:hypothetical protein
MRLKKLIVILFPVIANCISVGNPAAACLQTEGLIWEDTKWASLRTSFQQDYVYKQEFHEEFQIGDCKINQSKVKLWTQAGQITLNMKDRFDLYGIIGRVKLEIDEDVLTKQNFGWGVGGKFLIYNGKGLKAGCDLKYTETEQKPQFFQCDHFAYNVTSNFHYNYSEIQAAIGISYSLKNISPYANASYLISKLKALPPTVKVKIPIEDIEVNVNAKSIIGRNHIGMVLGATITDQKKASLNFEWRAFNQSAVNISGDLRF